MALIELRIDEVGDLGRCVHAARDINKGICVTKCELLVLPEFDTLLVNDTALKNYTFKYNERQDCIVLGDGSMFNHAPTLSEKNNPNEVLANVEYILQSWGDRKVMIFISLRDLKEGEQLFIDYSADTQVDVKEYLNSKSLTK